MNDEVDRSTQKEQDLDSDEIPLPIEDTLIMAFASELSLTVYEVNDQLVEGKKLWQIAQEQDTSGDDLDFLFHVLRKEVVSKALAERWIGRDKLNQVEDYIEEALLPAAVTGE